MNPTVSICIPTYNGEAYLAEALDSALAQTYPNLEIVVSDDASTDTTLEIVEKYQDKTSIPIHVFHHEPNGIGANWNNCIKQAQGEYIKFLFQDDVLEPTCVERMVGILDSQKVGLVGCKREFIMSFENESSELQEWMETFGDLQKSIRYYKRNNENAMVLNKRLFKSPMFLKSPLNKIGEPSVILFKRSLIEKTGGYREDFKQILDYEFYYRVLKNKGNIAIYKKALVNFRLHENQATNINKKNGFSDYVLMDKLLYKKYFWLLNRKDKINLLKKYNVLFKILLSIKRKIKLKLYTL
ncbi:glycosyltransferase family 2 protein [Xanthomarina gelatinilytica]|uniref:glycosyltransferase family 2 protein n=1 Tax=Xanthomarina gelatinilytica TaxID=1137281 RepID=UPI003AA98124